MSAEPMTNLYACRCCGWWGLESRAHDELPEPVATAGLSLLEGDRFGKNASTTDG